MSVVFAVDRKAKHPSLRMSDYFARDRIFTRVVLGERDWRIMRLLFENKIVSREQIGDQFFPGVCKDTVNKRLRKLVDTGLMRRKRAFAERLAIWGYSLTLSGLAQIKPKLPYEVKTRATRSECPLHDIALNDIRQVFEAKATVQGYYTENVLQTRTDFKNNEWFRPFVALNSDAMIEVDSKVGTLNFAIEFDTTHKNHRSYRRKLYAYYRQQKIDGVLYICANKYILHTLLKLDEEAAKLHHCQSKFYFAMFNDVIDTKSEMIFKSASGDIFCVH